MFHQEQRGLRRIKAKTIVLASPDDIAIFNDTPEGLQFVFTSYSDLAKIMGLCINTDHVYRQHS